MRIAKVLACLLILSLPSWLALTAGGAPVPLPKASPAKPAYRAGQGVAGSWAMRWGACDGLGVYQADGGYTHTIGASNFVGTWSVAGVRLHVDESYVHGDGSLSDHKVWEADLTLTPDGWSGTAEGDYGEVKFALSPCKGNGL